MTPLTPRLVSMCTIAYVHCSVVIWQRQRKAWRPVFSGSLTYWRCPHSMQSRVCVMVSCPSVHLSHRSTASAAAGGFAAELPAGRRYRQRAVIVLQASFCSAGAGAEQQMQVASRWEPTEARHRLVLACSLRDSRIYGTDGVSHKFTETMLVWTNESTFCDWQAVVDSCRLLICRGQHSLFVKHASHWSSTPNKPLHGSLACTCT